MPSVEYRLKQVNSKIERAKRHIADLDCELAVFFNSTPYGVSTKIDPESRKLVYYVKSVSAIPDELPLIAGDAIQNLACALDHLAYQVVCSDTNDQPPSPDRIYFPILDSAERYFAKVRGKIPGARQESIDVFDSIKPYKGGNDQLWILNRLNNIEKHRMLVAIGSRFESFNMGAFLAKELGNLTGQTVDKLNFFVNVADALLPLKEGDELFIDAVDAEPNHNMEFGFNVALYEPEIVEPQPILGALRQLTDAVDQAVVKLTLRLRDTP